MAKNDQGSVNAKGPVGNEVETRPVRIYALCLLYNKSCKISCLEKKNLAKQDRFPLRHEPIMDFPPEISKQQIPTHNSINT
jgi:hypothetical protein